MVYLQSKPRVNMFYNQNFIHNYLHDDGLMSLSGFIIHMRIVQGIRESMVVL